MYWCGNPGEQLFHCKKSHDFRKPDNRMITLKNTTTETEYVDKNRWKNKVH